MLVFDFFKSPVEADQVAEQGQQDNKDDRDDNIYFSVRAHQISHFNR